MKKIKISAASVALFTGIGIATAATAAFNDSNAFFEFDYNHYRPDFFNVQDESKWIRVNDPGACDNSPVKACRIEIGREYFRGNTLLPTATIIAQESSPGIAFVVGGNTISIRNKK